MGVVQNHDKICAFSRTFGASMSARAWSWIGQVSQCRALGQVPLSEDARSRWCFLRTGTRVCVGAIDAEVREKAQILSWVLDDAMRFRGAATADLRFYDDGGLS